MNCSASIKAKYVPRKNYESLINSRYCDRLWRYKMRKTSFLPSKYPWSGGQKRHKERKKFNSTG